MNLGGPPVGDFLSEEQVLDVSALSKNTVRSPVQNTDTPAVFQSQRFARGTDFSLRLPLPDGLYTVTLLFAETFQPACVPGGRVFDIGFGTPVSGVTKLVDGFDVFANAGCNAAFGKKFENVPSKDGIVVHLGRRNQHPTLAGFIVEGYPVPKGDGSEYKAIARAEGGMGVEGVAAEGAAAPGRRLLSVGKKGKKTKNKVLGRMRKWIGMENTKKKTEKVAGAKVRAVSVEELGVGSEEQLAV